MKAEKENQKKEASVGLFIGIAIFIIYLALALSLAVKGESIGLSGNRLIIAELSLLSVFLVLLLLTKLLEGAVLWVASLNAMRWFRRYDEIKQARSSALDGGMDNDERLKRKESLRNALRDRYGLRWKHRVRWILLSGEGSLVEGVAPGLTAAGWQFVNDALLINGSQSDGEPDAAWLTDVRKLRRRRPIDAIVALTRAEDSSNKPFDAELLAQRIARHARLLRWAAPAYLLNVKACTGNLFKHDESVGYLWSGPCADKEYIDSSLARLAGDLSDVGVARLSLDPYDRVAAELSQQIAQLRGTLVDLVVRVGSSRIWRTAVHGLLFAPIPHEPETDAQADEQVDSTLPSTGVSRDGLWQSIATHSRKVHGRRVGISFSTTAAWATTAAVALWTVSTLIAGISNRATLQEAATTLTRLEATRDPSQALIALDNLDKQLDTLETHRAEGAPWLTRFGLNHDAALLDALRPAYQSAASRVLIAPIQTRLEARLTQLASLSDAEIASGGNTQVQAAYDTLKTYLMLAHPEHADSSFLTTQLLATNAPTRAQNASVTQGTWEDLRQHAIAFYASHLKRDAAPAITADASLVASTRQTIIGVRGIQNSTDAIYQQIIEEAKPKYPPITLATLLGDHPSRGLFNTSATIPGVFTRAAWDERIPKAIDEASEQHAIAGDWVLSDAKQIDTAPSTLKAELRQRYFDDYARAWAQFLNSIRWQNAASLSGTVDQLTLLGDPQRSPLVALMNAIVYHANAGASTQSLSDNLISKAQQLVGADEKDPSKRAEPQRSQLATAFAPILRLTGSDVPNNPKAQQQQTGDLSLPRYLERVTAMRLKTQQMMSSADPDAMSRIAAQAMLQGKTSDLADSRDYASRLAASLGEQWSGFGKLFEAPLDQTWHVVVQPASASLNEIWRTSILADWNRNFGARYPFADSDNDASLPDMARFMRLDNGVITQFVSTQLAGVIERQGDHWVAAQGANQGTLALDPAFLAALNTLTRASTVMFPNGDARIRFELRGVPTPGVTDMTFVLAGREFRYFNQKEEWSPFEWPGQALENVTHVEWQTAQGGLRSALDEPGRFGLIRLLERAKVTQQDGARYLLSWTPDQSQALPLAVQLRADAGAGPLDVLALRHFTLPSRIFVTNPAKEAQKQTIATPPPLPPGALTAAARVGVPLPQIKTVEAR
ncbi:ImcF domain-containing protein [Caballeronia arvi]|uniref:ImcF domain-containing protein n=1 Tax=Caballeronia arvi TaxID=1777135 RepID=A0A158I399_9BURK|nr:ImcF-related family protein [Caballeronia arvi]SAL51082.1 ImcF domain-containing protein [Caballeronia arvi]